MAKTATPTELDPNLQEIATLVWRKTRQVARTVYGVLGEGVNERECRHYSELAAFLAFVDCGGDSDTPAAYDWPGNRKQLVKRAHHHMLQFLRRTDQTYDKDRVPLKRRTETVAVEQYCWDIWRHPITGNVGRKSTGREGEVDHGPVAQFHRGEYSPEEAEQERLLFEAALMELGSVLAKTLSDTDWNLIEAHYFEGRSQREVAKDLGISENTFNVRIHRARERARKILEEQSPQWRDIFKSLT